MPERKRKSGPNFSSIIGWVIFALVVAGGPILRGLQGALGGAVQLTGYLPYIIGGLVLLSFVASALRAAGGRSSAPRMPEPPSADPEPPRPLPPLGDAPGAPLPNFASEVVRGPLPQPDANGALRTPGFDPIVSPVIVVLGVLGLAVLGVAAALVYGLSLP